MQARLQFPHHPHTWCRNANILQCNATLSAYINPFYYLPYLFCCVAYHCVYRTFTTVDKRNISLHCLSSPIHIIIINTFDNTYSHSFDGFGGTIIDFQSATANTTNVNSRSAKINLPSTVYTLHRVASQEEVIAAFSH